MNNPRTLFDSTFRLNYFVYGSYCHLIKRINVRLNRRNRLDRAILRLQSIFQIKGKTDHKSDIIHDNLKKLFNNTIHSFILFNTNWYKESLYIGLLEGQNKLYFIKILSSIEDCEYQKFQSIFIQNNFSSEFTIPSIEKTNQNIIAYEYIEQSGYSYSDACIKDKIIALNKKFISESTIVKSTTTIIPDDFFYIIKEQARLSELVRNWINSNTGIEFPIIPVHGDMTPWNVFSSKDNSIILVDFESAHWNIPFYDYYHYILQPIALKSTIIPIRSIDMSVEYIHLRETLILYLIDQIYYNTRRMHEYSYNDKSIQNLLNNKIYWLLELLNEQ